MQNFNVINNSIKFFIALNKTLRLRLYYIMNINSSLREDSLIENIPAFARFHVIAISISHT